MNQNYHNERDLLKQHTPLVTSAVHQFSAAAPEVFSADHLHGLGLIALLKATRQYPPASRISFETFARIQIHTSLIGEIRRARNWFNSASAVGTSTPAFV